MSSKGRALLEAYRAVSEIEDQPDPAVLEHLEAELAASEAPRRVAAAAFLAVSVAVAASVTAVVAWPRPSSRVPEDPVSVAIDRARETSPRAARDAPEPAPSPSPSVPPSVAPEPVPSVAPTLAPKPSPVPSDDTLVRELALLRKAKTAMRDGRVTQAKAALREHGRSFPSGQLAEDREALWVIVRCGEHARNTGRAAFEAAHPSSHHLVAIRAACEEN